MPAVALLRHTLHDVPELDSLDPLHRDAVGECYKDVEDLIIQTVRKFTRTYGGDFDEWFGEAQLIFIKCYWAYANGCTRGRTFDGAVKRWVWMRLFDQYRRNSQHRRKTKEVYVSLPDDQAARPRKSFDHVGFLEQLSEDAKTYAALLLDMPEDLAAMAKSRGDGPHNVRSSVRSYLRERMGWTAARIRDSFAEVREAVGDL